MKTDNNSRELPWLATAPVNARLTPKKRMESCLQLSELTTKMATHVICHVIVDHEDMLRQERFSVASAFLQRVTSTHLCNHKLTEEGIVLNVQGQAFQLHEEFKTMMLTRSAYEHLVMFYFLYIHPKSDEERSLVWHYWKINGKKSLMSQESRAATAADSDQTEALRGQMRSTRIGMECWQKLGEWTAPDKPAQNGCIAFSCSRGRYDVRRVSYSQAWRYLFGKSQEDMDQLYRLLSIHSHPAYEGLMQYQDQAQRDEGFDGVPLYLSCSFLAYLCRLFLRLLPEGERLLTNDFSDKEMQLFRALSRLPAC